jgi:hypothetical protein
MAMFDDDWGSTDAVRTLIAPFRRTAVHRPPPHINQASRGS